MANESLAKEFSEQNDSVADEEISEKFLPATIGSVLNSFIEKNIDSVNDINLNQIKISVNINKKWLTELEEVFYIKHIVVGEVIRKSDVKISNLDVKTSGKGKIIVWVF